MNYTAQDIERYHNGKLSAAAMHAMEKAALDDPFLADALEGYANTKSASSDVVILQQKLAQRIEKDERRNPFFAGPQWMRIAALFLLIAGGGWLIIKNLEPSVTNEMATTSSDNKQQTPVTNQTKAADSVSTFSNAPARDETVAINRKVSAIVKRKEYKARNKKSFDKPAVIPATDPLINKSEAATITALNSEAAKIRDRADSLMNVTAMQKEEAANSRSRTNDTVRNMDVVLKKSDLALNEVVVINKKARATAPKLRQMQMKVDTLEPADGWDYFDDYIASNLKSPETLKIKPVSGEVELSFEVNKDGEPVNITVTRSLCDKCDEEAIRLLKEGPKWKNKAKKGKVKIRF